jgi:hypothetical protein
MVLQTQKKKEFFTHATDDRNTRSILRDRSGISGTNKTVHKMESESWVPDRETSRCSNKLEGGGSGNRVISEVQSIR